MEGTMANVQTEVPRLTVAMIVRNAGELIELSLVSIRAIADEIVVLDTGSTDDTISVAQRCGAMVHKRPWEDDFAAARNACLAKTSGDWILWLDAGERVGADSARELREFINAKADPQQAYLLPIVLPAAPGQIGGEQVYQIRLHPLEEGIAFAGRVRERLDDSLSAGGIGTQLLDIPIERSAREHDPAVKAARAQRNIRLADLALAEGGPSAVWHNCLGEALQILGDPLRAAQQYHRALRLAESKSHDLLEAYYGLLTCLEGAGPDRSAQLSLCMEAVDRFPLDAQLLVALGGYLQSLEQPQLAARAYDVAFRHGHTQARIWHLPDVREIAAVCAASIHQLLQSDDEARSLLEAAARTFPQSLRIGRQLVEVHVKAARQDEALAAVGSLALVPPLREAWALAVRGAAQAQHGTWPAARTYLQTARESGCEERFCLRWLVVSHLALNEQVAAKTVLQAWKQADPANPEIAELEIAAAEHPVDGSPQSATGPKILRVDAVGAVTPSNIAPPGARRVSVQLRD
jgi:tetratricopeptide (TPR) repeat protein